LIDTGVEFGVVNKSGNTYSFGEVKLGTGRENARQFLRGEKKLMQEIKKQIMTAAKTKAVSEE
jgi:recombination protein RecA